MIDDWYRDAVFYSLHVRAFADSNGDGIGDFTGLNRKLDYLADLGVTALWLLPFFPSPGRDDGYDIADYRTVNPDYGELRAFRRFLAGAHDRGLKVVTELVVNHTSDQHPWFQRARRSPPGSSWRDFYVWSDTADKYVDARVIFQDFETSNWTWDPEAGAYFWHRFYSHQPDLNYDNPEVEEAIFDVLAFWLDMGVDGVRLDAVPYLFEREGTNCENLPETHEVLKRLRKRIDAGYDARLMLAEANQWPEDAAAYFGDGDECHMNFHFPVMPRLFMAVRTEHRMPIVDILEQTPEPPAGCQWATFLRNHDELTLEMVTDEERDLMLRAYAHDTQMRINLGIRRRLAPLLGNDRRKIELLNALLFSLPGTPVIYYGDEIGMGDNIYLGDRNGVRTPMQWTADRNAGFSTASPQRLYLPLITEQGYHYEAVNAEAQQADPSSLLNWMRQLISLRQRHRVFGRGSITFLEPDNPHALVFVRALDGESPMLCVANLSRFAQQVEVDLRPWLGLTPVELFGHNRFAPIGELPYYLTLAPYGFFWFELTGEDSTAGADRQLPLLSGDLTMVMRRRTPLARAIGQWMTGQRWFAGKGSTIREVLVDDVFPLGARVDAPVALAVARVTFTEGDDHRYAVPVMRVEGAQAASTENLHPNAVIARLPGDGLLIDAMVLPEGAAVVAGAPLARRTTRGHRGTARGRPRRTGLGRLAEDVHDVHVLGVEQSNSSVILAGTVIAKLVRRLEPGQNPDVELPIALTEAGFSHVPRVLATLDLDLAGDNEPASAVMVHEAVANEGDLWEWSQSELARIVEDVVADPDALSAPADGRHDAGTLAMMGLLGQRTGELHRALVGQTPALVPQPFTLLWQRTVLQNVRSALRTTQRELRRHRPRLTDQNVALADLVLTSGDLLLAAFDRLRTEKVDAVRLRVHGDLHLGQVLWTGHDVVFIDFEGEPSRPIGERTIKRSPLVDTAGIVRSLDYAGRVAVATTFERARAGDSARSLLETWRSQWTERARAAFLACYYEHVGTPLVPGDPGDRDLVLDAYTLTKALYEVRYELAMRPNWVGWPLAAVAELIRTRAGEADPR
jgi:maltose alpha-D-glucosyltransferase/alpha-amylase